MLKNKKRRKKRKGDRRTTHRKKAITKHFQKKTEQSSKVFDYEQTEYPVNKDGTARWSTFDEVETATTGLDTSRIKQEFPDFQWKQWFNDGRRLLLDRFKGLKPSSTADKPGKLKIYSGRTKRQLTQSTEL